MSAGGGFLKRERTDFLGFLVTNRRWILAEKALMLVATLLTLVYESCLGASFEDLVLKKLLKPHCCLLLSCDGRTKSPASWNVPMVCGGKWIQH